MMDSNPKLTLKGVKYNNFAIKYEIIAYIINKRYKGKKKSSICAHSQVKLKLPDNKMYKIFAPKINYNAYSTFELSVKKKSSIK